MKEEAEEEEQEEQQEVDEDSGKGVASLTGSLSVRARIVLMRMLNVQSEPVVV